MFFLNKDDGTLIGLTFLDERNLARSVLDCLSIRWVAGGFSNLLESIYYHKCTTGAMIREDEMIQYLDYCERYELPMVEFEAGDGSIYGDLMDYYEDRDEINKEARHMVIKAWREVWEEHKVFQSIADAHKTFPGDVIREEEARTGRDLSSEQAKLDKLFWDEVNRLRDEYEAEGQSVSTADIIVQVSDYIPRSVLDLDLE